MSSKDHARLLQEGQQPAVPAAAAVGIPMPRRAPRTSGKPRSSGKARTSEKPRTSEKKPEGTRARSARAQAAVVAEAAAGTILRAGSRAKAAGAKAATKRAPAASSAAKAPKAPKALTVKAQTGKPRAGKNRTAAGAPAPVPPVRIAGPAAATRSASAPLVPGPAAARTIPARSRGSRTARARTAPVADRPAGPRATPFPRPRVAEGTGSRQPAPGPVAAPGAPEAAGHRTPDPSGRHPRRTATRRRPSLLLAAAVVGALGVGALPVANSTTEAHAHAGPAVSVAQELGLPAHPAADPVPAAASRSLGLLAASRAHREAEQTAAARAQRAAEASAVAAARPEAMLPVRHARLTSGFGFRWGVLHAGIDLAAPLGTPEYAVMRGVVLKAGPASGFGQAVYIQHPNGDVTVYGHMEKILVRTGQVVRAGQEIALLGAEGQATGPHLHLEVHVGGMEGRRIDPLPWLRARHVRI